LVELRVRVSPVSGEPLGARDRSDVAIGLRIFIVGDDGSVRPVSAARYDALVRRDQRGVLPEFAGKQVQAAIVSVQLDHRQPVAVTRLEYDVWYLDEDGLLSERREQELARAAVESLPVLVALSKDPLAAQRTRFGRERIKREYRWTPSPELHAYLCSLALCKR
jgi:hypothetical protein